MLTSRKGQEPSQPPNDSGRSMSVRCSPRPTIAQRLQCFHLSSMSGRGSSVEGNSRPSKSICDRGSWNKVQDIFPRRRGLNFNYSCVQHVEDRPAFLSTMPVSNQLVSDLPCGAYTPRMLHRKATQKDDTKRNNNIILDPSQVVGHCISLFIYSCIGPLQVHVQ